MRESWKAFTQDTLANLHILLVEDDQATSAFFKFILEYTGALVTVAETAEHALRILDRVIPDVLVSDIAMPLRDGFWLISQVRARPAKQGGTVPAIAVTAGGYRRDQALAAGFQVYLGKPIDPDLLCQAIGGIALKESGRTVQSA